MPRTKAIPGGPSLTTGVAHDRSTKRRSLTPPSSMTTGGRGSTPSTVYDSLNTMGFINPGVDRVQVEHVIALHWKTI